MTGPNDIHVKRCNTFGKEISVVGMLLLVLRYLSPYYTMRFFGGVGA